jgi:LPXTG-motif cell wall-anchored protein
LVVIADPETPLALPQTGGLMTYATPAALALAVLIALYAATYVRGRKKTIKETAE